MSGYLWIVIAFIVILLIGPASILIEKVVHWMRKHRGVTELSSKQRRRQALHYKETTGRRSLKKRRVRRKSK
jgi:Sec-independent protein translocase protein TatA